MAPRPDEAHRPRPETRGAHRKLGKRRKAFTRALAAGGAAISIGAAYDLSTPNADALSILLPGRTVDGVGNTTRINILEGNIFNPQLGIRGGNVSDNTTVGNVAVNRGNGIISRLLDAEIRLGRAAGNGNTTQINILSYNIFNPQFSLARNVSNNTSVNNVATGNGNNSTTEAATAGGLFPWLGGATGNGNTVQFSFFSGNIFNPQYSLGGGNLSNNTTFTNVAIGNGNYSGTTLSLGGWFGTFLVGGGNGNTLQLGFFVSNVYNPQFTFGGGNISYNTAGTNTAIGNGNNSTNEVTGGGLGTTVTGTVGNGNTNQSATGSGNIYNDQVNIGPGSTSTVSSNTTGTVEQVVGALAVNSDNTDADLRAADVGESDTPGGTTRSARVLGSTSRVNPDADDVVNGTVVGANPGDGGNDNVALVDSGSPDDGTGGDGGDDSGGGDGGGGDSGD